MFHEDWTSMCTASGAQSREEFERQWRTTARVQRRHERGPEWRRLELKHAACVWFIVSYLKYGPHDRQTSQQTIYQYSQTAWVMVASSERHAQTTLVRNRQRFSSWFGCEAYSAWMCSHSSYWQQTQTLLLFRGLCALTYPRSLAGQILTQGESLVKFP